MFKLFFEVQYHSKADLNKIFADSVHDCSALHVCSFILSILHQGIFSVSAFIVSVMYLSRFKESSHITLHACTWRPLFLTSLLLADKMWEDKPVRNSSLAKLFPVLSNRELNKMESEYLTEIRFNVLVKPDLFCSFCEKLLMEQVHPDITRGVAMSEYAGTLVCDDDDVVPAKSLPKVPTGGSQSKEPPPTLTQSIQSHATEPETLSLTQSQNRPSQPKHAQQSAADKRARGESADEYSSRYDPALVSQAPPGRGAPGRPAQPSPDGSAPSNGGEAAPRSQSAGPTTSASSRRTESNTRAGQSAHIPTPLRGTVPAVNGGDEVPEKIAHAPASRNHLLQHSNHSVPSRRSLPAKTSGMGYTPLARAPSSGSGISAAANGTQPSGSAASASGSGSANAGNAGSVAVPVGSGGVASGCTNQPSGSPAAVSGSSLAGTGINSSASTGAPNAGGNRSPTESVSPRGQDSSQPAASRNTAQPTSRSFPGHGKAQSSRSTSQPRVTPSSRFGGASQSQVQRMATPPVPGNGGLRYNRTGTAQSSSKPQLSSRGTSPAGTTQGSNGTLPVRASSAPRVTGLHGASGTRAGGSQLMPSTSSSHHSRQAGNPVNAPGSPSVRPGSPASQSLNGGGSSPTKSGLGGNSSGAGNSQLLLPQRGGSPVGSKGGCAVPVGGGVPLSERRIRDTTNSTARGNLSVHRNNSPATVTSTSHPRTESVGTTARGRSPPQGYLSGASGPSTTRQPRACTPSGLLKGLANGVQGSSAGQRGGLSGSTLQRGRPLQA